MRSKKIFSFNEERDAEEIITGGFPNGLIDYNKMYLVAKYFRENFNYGEIRLERELIKFCQAQDKNFNPVVDAESIKKWITSAMNYRLRRIDSVNISKKEIDFLHAIENPRDRKLLFITLVLSKALKKRSTKVTRGELKTSDKYYIHYSNLMDIIRLSGIKNVSEMELANIFHGYKEHFLFYSPERELVRVEYIDKHDENGIPIENLDKLLEYYELFFGKNRIIGSCVICGKEIVKNSNKQKHCQQCAQKIRREQKRLWIKNSRKNVDQ